MERNWVYWRLGPWLQGNKGIKPSMVKKVAKVSHAGASGGTSKNGFLFTEFHRLGPVGPAICMGFCWIPQPEDGRKSLLEIAEIELSLVFSPESNGSKWVEMG